LLGGAAFLVYALVLFSPLGGGRASLAFGGKILGAMCGARFCFEPTGYTPQIDTLFRDAEVAFRYGAQHADRELSPVTAFDTFYITMMAIIWFAGGVLPFALAVFIFKEAWQGRFYVSPVAAFRALNGNEESRENALQIPGSAAFALFSGLLLASNFCPWICALFCCR